jgi:hypothetical protein
VGLSASTMRYFAVAVIRRQFGRLRVQSVITAVFFAFAAVAATPNVSLADEDGISFWIPGFFGSLAAAPQQPGWSLASIYYHTSVSATGNAALSREITVGRFNPSLNVSVSAHVSADADLGILAPSYTFATPVLGGQATAYLLGLYGSNNTSLDGTLSGTLGPIPFSRSFALEQSDIVFGDLIPIFTLRWNAGVNNYMTYLAGDIPVGKYDSTNIDNLGLGHGAFDGGVGYTYFDEKTGHEFSAVLGLTGNFQNPSTGYTSGIDSHLDWGASQFLTKQLQVGLVGYFYEQLTSDSGCAPQLCPFESRVIGVGPQIGYIFPVGNMQGYLNLKAYGEFANNDRPDGWNAWLTFVLSPAPAAASSKPSHLPMLTK